MLGVILYWKYTFLRIEFYISSFPFLKINQTIPIKWINEPVVDDKGIREAYLFLPEMMLR
jgi:hypothetical protein